MTRTKELRSNSVPVTRETTTRDAESIDDYDMGYVSPLTIPEEVKKDGYSYAWVNSGVNDNSFNVEDRLRQRWQLVPVDRAPHMAVNALGRNSIAKDYISYKDLVLMERESKYDSLERARLQKINDDQIKSLTGVTDADDGFMQTRVSRERL